ncbi:MAG: acyl-ACP--UDP-N-acetylglucosamine O-acyltransferase [bacterium]|jgi:UDP-N-acetylglucosamine acyltransferase
MTGETMAGAGIHPAAFVDPAAEIGPGVSIGPGSIVGPNVKIGKDTAVGANCLIDGWTEIGSSCRLGHGVVIGTEPQDLKFRNEKTFVRIGDGNTIREYATVHRATGEGEATVVGDNNFIMAYVHIAHNCVVGSNTVLANGVNMAGHVTIEDYAAISGLCVVHQFVRVGSYSYTGGGSRIPMDIVPFIKVAGNPPLVNGLNSVGLKRNGFKPDTIATLKRAYRLLFRSNLNVTQSLEKMKSELPMIDEVKHLIEFIEGSERGIQL